MTAKDIVSQVKPDFAFGSATKSLLVHDIREAIEARFKDKDGYLRWPVIESTLSDEILKAIAAWLEHEDSYYGHRASNVLRDQPTLSDETLKAIAARLANGKSMSDMQQSGRSKASRCSRRRCSKPLQHGSRMKAVTLGRQQSTRS